MKGTWEIERHGDKKTASQRLYFKRYTINVDIC